jgi:hypothetical protein
MAAVKQLTRPSVTGGQKNYRRHEREELVAAIRRARRSPRRHMPSGR